MENNTTLQSSIIFIEQNFIGARFLISIITIENIFWKS